jgi:hypothetical protein
MIIKKHIMQSLHTMRVCFDEIKLKKSTSVETTRETGLVFLKEYSKNPLKVNSKNLAISKYFLKFHFLTTDAASNIKIIFLSLLISFIKL